MSRALTDHITTGMLLVAAASLMLLLWVLDKHVWSGDDA